MAAWTRGCRASSSWSRSTPSFAELVARVEATGYDRAEHDAVRAEVATLRPMEALRADVETAEGALAPARARRAGTAELLAAREAALAATAVQLAELAQGAAARPRSRPSSPPRRARSTTRSGRAGPRTRRSASPSSRSTTAGSSRSSRAERVANAARAGEEKTIYDELALAFGKKGIQAMLIETAIPEIEREANELLGRMTDGNLNLTFETQRDTKKGDVSETLEIKIADGLGTRDYEMYSAAARRSGSTSRSASRSPSCWRAAPAPGWRRW